MARPLRFLGGEKMLDKNEQLQACLSYYAAQRDRSEQQTVVQMLRELQEIAGFLTPEIKAGASEASGVKMSVIELYIRAYPDLKSVDYDHEIVVCTGARCGQKGGPDVLRALNNALGIKSDGLSRDGRILLKTQNCLKQCAASPNIKIDGKLYSGVCPENIPKLLEKTII